MRAARCTQADMARATRTERRSDTSSSLSRLIRSGGRLRDNDKCEWTRADEFMELANDQVEFMAKLFA